MAQTELTIAARRTAAWAALVALLAPTTASAGTTQDLHARAEARAKAELARCGCNYTAHIDRQRHIVYVSALDADHLRRAMALLTAHAAAYRHMLPCDRPAWNVVVVLPTLDDYPKLMPKSVAGKNVTFLGFYEHAAHRLTSVDYGRVLRHEFTHALHHADASAARQVHPTWVAEGLATLLEDARITPSGLQPQCDARLWTLQKAVRQHKLLPLAQFLRMGQRSFLRTPDLSYARARYLMLYLHEKGRLGAWYRRFKAEYSRDPSGQKALEGVLGTPLAAIEREWTQWVQTLEYKGNPSRTGQGRLGITMAGDSRGVKVTALLEGGSARRAGRLREGDVIRQFNGQPTRNVMELTAAIRAAGAKRTVTVELLRGGRPMTVQQPLGSPTP